MARPRRRGFRPNSEARLRVRGFLQGLAAFEPMQREPGGVSSERATRVTAARGARRLERERDDAENGLVVGNGCDNDGGNPVLSQCSRHLYLPILPVLLQALPPGSQMRAPRDRPGAWQLSRGRWFLDDALRRGVDVPYKLGLDWWKAKASAALEFA